MKNCPHCKIQIPKDSVFCGFCGQKVKFSKEEKEQAKLARQRVREEKQRLKLEKLNEQNNKNRRKNLKIYQDNADIISGWEWIASKSLRSCIKCLLMDGKRFPSSVEFKSHDGCRCTMIAVIESLPRRPRISGRDWFETLDVEAKREILGEELFTDYVRGKTLDEIAAEIKL